MSKLKIVISTAFGSEAITSNELKKLGYSDLKTENGRISFVGNYHDIAKCNTWLRTADRVLINMAEFPASDFDELFDNTEKLPWEEFIPENGKMHIIGKSVKSQLHSVPACQSMVKKAIIKAMQRKYNITDFKEDGPVYKIEISINKDFASLNIDTSGPGLHKRGYRTENVKAPLRETLAAAMILLSRWTPDRLLVDPFCGSGTIAIEAAMIAKNIAPGLNRNFAAESWPNIPKQVWEETRKEARSCINNEIDFKIMASDIEFKAIKTATANAERAEVSNHIIFQKKPFEEFSSKETFGCIVTNPPYGIRIGEKRELESIYQYLKNIITNMDTWSFFILSGDEDFQKKLGKKANKNRKLYNSAIKCYIYQYLGPLPKKR